MEELILLRDYRNTFASKFDATPYRSGIDIKKFSTEMEQYGYELRVLNFQDLQFSKPHLYHGVKVLYQSSEANDVFGEYKSFIDDVLYFLKLSGAKLIPEYRYFKAHTNKVFMEMLRGFMKDNIKPKTAFHGSLEEFKSNDRIYEFPVVVKKYHGAQSNGVFKANNSKELQILVEKISKSSFPLREIIKEKIRKLKYKNYNPHSTNRNKFIVQSFTRNLAGDYKILIFHDIFYIVKRDNPPNDFRASGGGYNSFAGEFDIPEGLVNYCYKIFEQFNCPYVSLDVGINKEGFHLIEFQMISFGTSGHSKSKFMFRRTIEDDYRMEENKLSIEFLYGYALHNFLKS